VSNAPQTGLTVARPEGGAVADPNTVLAPTDHVLSITARGDVERVDVAVRIPAGLQYPVGWGDNRAVALTSGAYDYLNRVIGVQFFRPEYTHDEHGDQQRNPIMRSGFIQLELVGVWWNDLGAMMSYSEILPLDFQLAYHDARINSKSAQVATDANGEPLFHPQTGIPIIKISAGDELKAMRLLSQMRTYGVRYVQTVVKTRILKVVTGIKTLPGLREPQDFRVKVTGFKDALTPEQRIAKAQASTETLFGKAVRVNDADGLTADEMREVGEFEEPDLDRIDQQIIGDAHAARGVAPDFDPTTIPGVKRGMPEQPETADQGDLLEGIDELPVAGATGDDDAADAFERWQAEQERAANAGSAK
jgi:hypothetical protein